MAAYEKKKPSLALVVGKGKADEEPEEDGDGAMLDELADVLGVADDKRSDFAEAFRAAVSSCK